MGLKPKYVGDPGYALPGAMSKICPPLAVLGTDLNLQHYVQVYVASILSIQYNEAYHYYKQNYTFLIF